MFGFSIGDFIVGINLLVVAVKSLDDTNSAQGDYQELGRELEGLKKAIECIENLSLDPTQLFEVSAINTTISNCRLCIDGFVERHSKFKSLASGPEKQWNLRRFRKAVRAVQWALWKKDDVTEFRSQIGLHAEALHMLLASLQMSVFLFSRR